MALRMRLARHGSKKNPHYSVVVIQSTKKRDGEFVEKIGHYHPTMDGSLSDKFVVNTDRLKYWVGVGASPTHVVVRLVRGLKLDVLDKHYKPFVKSSVDGMSKKAIAQKVKEDKKKAEEAAKMAKEDKKKAEEDKQKASVAQSDGDSSAVETQS